ncbi:IS1595 family transposase [Iamia sp.]|uniref:IS1595 family transposase n=1 Tax=Iamia sp. TaxID=2722710 RepID=UPI002B8E2EB3|nr:IS1595 family transposase [Iamia sp.]HXH57005.1 IS1595 family transposase [Iamia sp.]
MPTQRLPRTLVEAVRYFSDEDVCVQFVASLRWENGPVCPRCGSDAHYYLASRRVWKCRDCAKQYSVKVGTIFEDSPIKLDKWLCAIWLIANSKNGISSHELGRAIGVTQKSAWFMLQRIRLAMQTGTFERFDGTVEVDETFIGGKARNMHENVRKRKIVSGRGGADKTVVMGAKSRDGKVTATVVPDRNPATLDAFVRDHVAEGSNLYTDGLAGYRALADDYDHATVDHANVYVDGQVHTNGIENFWSLLKRGLHGTYISVEPFHLFRYIDERVFTFNHREADDLTRFATVVEMVAGRRLTWDQVTGRA